MIGRLREKKRERGRRGRDKQNLSVCRATNKSVSYIKAQEKKKCKEERGAITEGGKQKAKAGSIEGGDGRDLARPG